MNKGKQYLSDRAKNHLLKSAEIKSYIAENSIDDIMSAAESISNAFRCGGKLLLCGNGGSAADCQHMAAEFVSLLNQNFNRPGLTAIALTTDTSFLTAYSNDFGFEGVFERQVRTLGRDGDVLIGISTSGNSRNVIRAIEASRSINIQTIVLTGSGGELTKIADIAVAVPSSNTQHIQESHIAIEHILCDLVEYYIFNEKSTREDI